MKGRWIKLMTACMFVAVFSLVGCEGDDGNDGADGAPGAQGDPGLACWDLNGNGEPDLVLPDPPFTEDLNGNGVVDVNDCNGLIGTGDPVSEAVAAAKPESCGTCHSDADVAHQSEYDAYVDTTLAMEITSVTSAPGAAAGTFDVTVEFSITQDGAAYIDPVGAEPSLENCGFYIAQYDSAIGEFVNTGGENFGSLKCKADRFGPGFAASNGDGTYTLLQTLGYDPLAVAGGAIMGVVGNDLLSYEDKSFAARVRMYDDLASATFVFGDYGNFESVANVAGCARCHSAPSSDGTLAPYRKHAAYQAEVDGAPAFSMCRGCHRDDANGGHTEWQWMMDDPLAWGTFENFGDPLEDNLPPEILAKYAYDRNLFNDVHMAHAMELAYPQSMANCATCHEGKLDLVLADENFVAETCKSCHVEDGVDASPELGEEDQPGYVEEGDYYQEGRPPSMEWIWADEGVAALHTGRYSDPTFACDQCHVQGGIASTATFSDLHSGYDERIYDADGNRYADIYTVSIDSVSLDGDVLTVGFSANDDSITPTLAVSLYGWDSKDFYIASHTRDVSGGCNSSGCRMEYTPGQDNDLFTETANSVDGAWEVELDFAAFVPSVTDDIPTLIAEGIVKKAEITILPRADVNLSAVTQTIDLTDAAAFVENYFKGTDAIADEAKCENCHDFLGVPYHNARGRGGDLVACRNCHNPTYDGSHWEMASRSLTNYVHAAHTMQYMDSGDVDFTDPVEYARYYLHIEEFFPVFTAQSCEACHESGKYGVPDQSKSMPAVQSQSDTWNVDRNIGSVPPAVTGPASTACGGCHRGEFINEDDSGALYSFNAHTGTFGTYVDAEDPDDEGEPDEEIVYGIIDKIMTLFQ